MRKFLFAIIIALFTSVAVMAADRSHTLKVLNWADYIDPGVLENFPAWYYEQTGEEVDVIYQTFDINETALTSIELGHEDYDVFCPSEYIIDRMIKKNLLIPIDRDFGSTPDYTANISPFAADKLRLMSDTVDVLDYAVGYMWGTAGFLYNPQYVDSLDVRSWGVILDPKYKGKLLMKDAYRDVYSVLVQYAYREDIANGTVDRQELVANPTQERIDSVLSVLQAAKDNIAGWEVDFGKEQMAKGEQWIDLMWSGDAQWAIDESEPMGIMLDYAIPDEGSIVWFDGWVIPAYAKNVKAARYFINYLCIPENAIANMQEAGYVSTIGTIEIAEAMADDGYAPIDASYFFGIGFDEYPVNPIYYPDRSVIERCALMHDVTAEQSEALLSMWGKAKHTDHGWVLWVFGGVLALAFLIFAYSKVRPYFRKKKEE
jgi:spermidine/putrescine transport system substrate-binding protein